jgi:hypothetical protein
MNENAFITRKYPNFDFLSTAVEYDGCANIDDGIDNPIPDTLGIGNDGNDDDDDDDIACVGVPIAVECSISVLGNDDVPIIWVAAMAAPEGMPCTDANDLIGVFRLDPFGDDNGNGEGNDEGDGDIPPCVDRLDDDGWDDELHDLPVLVVVVLMALLELVNVRAVGDDNVGVIEPLCDTASVRDVCATDWLASTTPLIEVAVVTMVEADGDGDGDDGIGKEDTGNCNGSANGSVF